MNIIICKHFESLAIALIEPEFNLLAMFVPSGYSIKLLAERKHPSRSKFSKTLVKTNFKRRNEL